MKLTQRTALAFLLLFVFSFRSKAQIAGTFSVPGTFPTIAAAITTLNTMGVAGHVTIYVSAGHTETATAGGYKLYTIAGAASTAQVTFQKNGVGANPIIYAYSGGAATPTSSVQDGVWWLIGADYVTIDGIDITDP
ncbi:MAG: hypothetical protein JNL60_01390, partial [Bacteroidia bacterium]|nr:hypothetical protein [Bacteroidia bacterium]